MTVFSFMKVEKEWNQSKADQEIRNKASVGFPFSEVKNTAQINFISALAAEYLVKIQVFPQLDATPIMCRLIHHSGALSLPYSNSELILITARPYLIHTSTSDSPHPQTWATSPRPDQVCCFYSQEPRPVHPQLCPLLSLRGKDNEGYLPLLVSIVLFQD